MNFVVELLDKITKQFVDQIVVESDFPREAEMFAARKTQCIARVVTICNHCDIKNYSEFWEAR